MNVVDQINFVKTQDLVNLGQKVLTVIQLKKPGLQVATVAYVFAHMCERLNLNPLEIIAKSQRITKSAKALNLPEVYALDMYIDEELKDKQL